jgi:hypothetical protein
MANQLTQKNLTLFKFNANPAVADFVTVTNKVIVKPDVKKVTYSEANGKLANEQSYVDPSNITTKFNLELMLRGHNKAADALTTPPKIADLLKSCGLYQSVGVDEVSYTPLHVDYAPSKAIVYLDDFKREVTGIRSNLKISGKIGEVAKVTFECQGFTTAKPIGEVNPVVTKDKESLLLISSVSVITLGGTTVNLESFEFDLGNDIKNEYLTESKEFGRGDFKPKINLKGKKEKGDEDSWDDLIEGTIREIVITLGDTAGKRFQLKASQCELGDNSENDTDGKVYFDKKFDLRGDDSGENHFKLTWN